MESIISYPNRGPFGKSNYRGNCSGHVLIDLIKHFKPTLLVDVCKGSGTSEDVCNTLNIPYVGLDLHTGFDFTKDYVLNHLEKPADLVFSHPPYHNMIDYKKERNKHGLITEGNDISNLSSPEEFLEYSQLMLMNQREATIQGGIYTSLIGDYRKNGAFHSFQSDYINMMPKDELISVTIKAQHNCLSSSNSYSGNFIPIMHEYLLVWKKKSTTLFSFLNQKIEELQNLYNATWKNIIKIALMQLEGQAPLTDIYLEVSRIAPERIIKNQNYRAKVRQTLQQHFNHVERGVWAA